MLMCFVRHNSTVNTMYFDVKLHYNTVISKYTHFQYTKLQSCTVFSHESNHIFYGASILAH